MSPRYKVVECSTVTDESLEAILNQGTREGWRLESIQFAMGTASRRPAMAFVLFTREGEAGGGDAHGGRADG